MLIIIAVAFFLLFNLSARARVVSRPYGKAHHDTPGAAHEYDERLSYLVRGTR